MSGETDQALEMHNKYAQFQLNAKKNDSSCFTTGTPNNLEGWGRIDKTIHLKPFLELLVKELWLRTGRELSVKSLDVAKANWIGREDLFSSTLSSRDLITALYANNPDDYKIKGYRTLYERLGNLKLVFSHMAIVVLDAAVEWIEAIDAKSETSVQRLFRIRNLVEKHLNFCSVATVKVSIVDGVREFSYRMISYNVDNNKFEITNSRGGQSLALKGSLVENWENSEGVYSMHKGEIIEKISSVDATVIERYRELQVGYFNDFIKAVK
jgi:hypothetical protein